MDRISPDRSLELAVLAERLGFDTISLGDHFHPFFHTDAQCVFA
jgi:alkanesulfonate monooxygenase SsuD/methylene tetrahydromethanopterin reductase-like flavin-dependent oxidoreductase (luciferase family)